MKTEVERPRRIMSEVLLLPATPTPSPAVVVAAPVVATPTGSPVLAPFIATPSNVVVSPFGAPSIGLPIENELLPIPTLALLLATIAQRVDGPSVLALHRFLASTNSVLRLHVKVVGVPLVYPAGSAVPLIYETAGLTIKASWDGESMIIVDTAAVALGLVVVAPAFKTSVLHFGSDKDWKLVLTPAPQGTFLMSGSLIADLQLSTLGAAVVIALLMGNPTVFATTGEAIEPIFGV
jgi:hypothetical protein